MKLSIRGAVERLYSGQKNRWDENREDELMRVSKNYLGVGFEVWNNQQSWFWLVDNTNRNGTIGAAASESDAIAEAHSSIEEISNSSAETGWECSLGKLARYLASVCGTNA
jgi:hypothetical protein